MISKGYLSIVEVPSPQNIGFALDRLSKRSAHQESSSPFWSLLFLNRINKPLQMLTYSIFRCSWERSLPREEEAREPQTHYR